MKHLIARLRSGAVTPADLDAAADAIEGRVKVRELVWLEIEDDDCEYESYAFGFRYWIKTDGDECELFLGVTKKGKFAAYDAAKAAAQADYAARIMAAIEVTP